MVFTFWVLMFGFMPAVAGGFFDATSAAAGLAVVTCSALLVLKRRAWLEVSLDARVIAIAMGLLVYSLAQQVMLGHFGSKSLFSVLLVVFLLQGSNVFAKKIMQIETQLPLITRNVCLALMAIAIFNYSYDFQFASDFYEANRSVFPFGEPSHFALFSGPFFVLWGITLDSGYKKGLLLVGMFAAGLEIQSFTFLIYAFIFFFVLVTSLENRASQFWSVSVFLGIIGTIMSIVNMEYFIERVILSPESNNLTALVYLQGLQDARNAVTISGGLGIGFQMLGTQPPSEATFIIANILGMDPVHSINRFDGGTLAVKVVAEFGVLGICLLAFYVWQVALALKKLARWGKGQLRFSYIQLGFYVFLVCSLVEVFVRGIGYFSPSLYFVVVMYAAYVSKNKYRRDYLNYVQKHWRGTQDRRLASRVD